MSQTFLYSLTGVGLALLTCALSLGLTRLLIQLLPKWGLLDIPKDERRVHTVPVPRGGGIGMIVAFIVIVSIYRFLALQFSIPQLPTLTSQSLKLLVPLVILIPLGIIDDKFGLGAGVKFFAQTAAAVLAWFLGFHLEHLFGWELPAVGCFILTVLWIVLFINAFNLIDGLDGLASGVGCISSICLCIMALTRHESSLAVMLMIFTGALLGFLRYNWHPAKLFMGDTGSMFIGYILAVVGLTLNAHIASVTSIFIPLLACGVPFIDTSFAIWRRFTASEEVMSENPEAGTDNVPPQDSLPNTAKVYSDTDTDSKIPLVKKHRRPIWRIALGYLSRLGHGDKLHLHHRLLRYHNNNQHKAVLSMYWIAACMGIAGIVCCSLPSQNEAMAFLIVLGVLSIIVNRFAVIELWNSTEIIYTKFQTARMGMLISNIFNPIIDLACIVFAYAAACDFSIGLPHFLRHIGILLVVLMLSRNFHVFWNFSASEDYFRLIVTIAFGTLVAYLTDFCYATGIRDIQHLYACGIAISMILTERLALHYLRQALIRIHVTSKLSDCHPINTVIFGIVPEARLYRNLICADIEKSSHENIIGLLARNRRYRHSYCYSLRVLGSLEDLEYIHQHYNLGKIVLARETVPEEKVFLNDFCKRYHLQLVTFYCKETPIAVE